MCLKTPKAPKPNPEKERKVLISRQRFDELMIPTGRATGFPGGTGGSGFGFTGLNIPTI